MMRLLRGAANAVLMATLVKPVVRRMLAQWRKRAQESPAATIGVPMEGLLEAALLEELAGAAEVAESPPAEILEEAAGRGAVRTIALVGIVVALTTGIAWAIATLVRRRREAAEAQAQDPEWVAVPVDASSPATEEASAQESLAR